MLQLPIRRAFLSLALLLCSGIVGESAAQQQALNIAVSSGLSGGQLASAITVTPSTSPVTVAQALSTRAAGVRVLLLTGFADDLTSSDTVVVATKAKSLQRSASRTAAYPSPWIDNGIARARQRASAWVAAYGRTNGVAPDLVIIRCRATMAASSYLPRVTPAGWAVVCSDRRFPALSAAIGALNLQATMYSSAPTRAAWDAYFGRLIDSSIESSVGIPFASAYPNSVICMESRYAANAELATVAARAGSAMRVQQVPFSLASAPSVGFASIGAIVSDLRRVGPAAAVVPTINAPGSAQWRNVAAPLATVLQAEIVRHAAAIGIRFAWSNPAGWNLPDGQSVLAAVRDANAVLGTNVAAPTASTPSFDSTRIFVSGSVRAGITTWRISMADGVQTALATFADGSSRLVQRAAGAAGGWLSHSESAKLVSVQPASTPAQTPEFVLLSDDVTATASGSLSVRPYMIIYQGVDPQSYGSARIDVARVIAAVGEEIAAGRGSDWGVLDFENPFQDILRNGASDPRYATAMASLVEALRAVKLAYPAVRWTYYDLPTVPYWINNRDWNSLSAQERIDLQNSLVAKYSPLLDELDWFLPSIYDRYERSQFGPNMLPLITLSETSFREATVGFLQHYMAQPGKVRRPVIPMACPWFIEGGLATQYRPIGREELIADQLRPAILSGADGIALWCSTNWLYTLATRSSAELPQYLTAEQDRVRNQFQADLLGGQSIAAVDWTSTANRTLVRTRLSEVVAGAVSAVNQVYSERAASSPGAPSGPSLVLR